MSEYLADPTILGIMLLISSATAAVALVMLYLSPRQKKKLEESVTATSEWQPTGKIDFHCAETPHDDKVPAAFLLRVEDYRTVESISGVEHMEIRWRDASLAEAKSVVVAHQTITDTAAKGYQLPRLVRAPDIADNGPGDVSTMSPATSAFAAAGR
jgi:hypothetical protein